MKLKKINKFLMVIFICVTLFALGCAGQTSSTSSSSTSKPSTSTTVTTVSTTTSSTTVSTTTTSKTSTSSTSSVSTPKLMQWSKPPDMQIDTKKQYIATLKTNRGDLVLELFTADAPVTVNNFVFLIRQGFYDNTVFHRVIAGFMAQGGDPTATGRGGPGYKFADEFSSKTHETGTLSMANSGPNTNGSQFFITHAPQPHLNGKHSVFGRLKDSIKGMEVLLKIKQGDKLIKATVEEK
jgi:peptidyl-prolyl cis-trans isomerase B (cyclophilin B)